jgi:hypothetical protein
MRSIKNKDFGLFQKEMAKNALKTFNLNELTDCSICMVEIMAPCRISQLVCNEHHFFHENCL